MPIYRAIEHRRMKAIILPSTSHEHLNCSKRIRSDALQAFLKVLTFAYSFFI
jgi:hypothetical protein